MAAEHHAGHDHAAPTANYLMVFGALCVFTVISILVDQGKSHFGRVMLVAAVLAVACFKAGFVMLYFMHLKFEGAWKYVLLAPTIVLALALPFTLAPDISFPYYTKLVPQSTEPPPPLRTHGADEPASGEHKADPKH